MLRLVMLLIRLVRALWIFGIVLVGYLFHLALLKVFRRWERDPETGREVARIPPWLKRQRERLDARSAKRMLHGMLRLRGVYIKLGQVLSVMGGFLPQVVIKELETLQDAVPPHPFSDVERVIQESLGKPYDQLFERMEKEPIAAASLGQVHVAYLPDGTKLAVKVLYPGIRDVIRVDMRVVRLMLRVYKYFVPIQNIESVHEALVDLLRRETDYIHEAACIERMTANSTDDDGLLFPKVIHHLTTSDVLTMTFMEGFKITDFAAYERLGVDREKVATRLIKMFYKQCLVDRFFHADPHPGNFLVQPGPNGDGDGYIVVLDFGAISEVSQKTVDGMVDTVRGFLEQDDALVIQGIEEIGFFSDSGDRALFEQTVKIYLRKLLQMEDRTPAALMKADAKQLQSLADPELERQELRQLMKSVHYPEGWFYVERAALMAFWLAAQIAPHLEALMIGFPYVMPLLTDRIAQAAKEKAERHAAEAPAAASSGA